MSLRSNPAFPALLLIVQQLTTVSVITFVPPSALFLRFSGLGVMAMCLLGVVTSIPELMRTIWAQLFGASSGFLFLMYIDLALVRRCKVQTLVSSASYKFWRRRWQPYGLIDDTSPRAVQKPRAAGCRQWRWAFQFLLNARKVALPIQVKGVPACPEHRFSPRMGFFRSAARRALFCCFVLSAIPLVSTTNFGRHVALGHVGEPVLHLLARRATVTTLHWAYTYSYICLSYDAVSSAAVVLGIHQPHDWPPVFGPAADMCTLRGFWGSAWHQLVRDPVSRPADWLIHRVFPKSMRPAGIGLVPLHCRALVVFFLSGIAHACGDLASGVPLAQTGSLHFFVLQAMGFVLEDYFRVWALGETRVGSKTQGWSVPVKSAGFVWVAAWLCLTTPVWSYPVAAYYDGLSFLPFSLAKFFFLA